MISHLFQKFKSELEKFLEWLLMFANRLPEWQLTKPYEIHDLASFNVELSENPLLVIEVTVE